MDLDKKKLKALASDTRISIIRLLQQRRMMLTEIAQHLGLSPPAVLEHLQKLEDAGLVIREPPQRKWVYYELTPHGRTVLNPVIPIHIVVGVFGAVVLTLLLLGMFYMQNGVTADATKASTPFAAAHALPEIQETPQMEKTALSIEQLTVASDSEASGEDLIDANVSVKTLAINTCIDICKQKMESGANLSAGPCLSDDVAPGWVCDVAHSPREAVDNNPDNQCQTYRSREATHFVEVDENCAYIRSR